MDKKYISQVAKRAALPRSKRLRETGNTASTGGSTSVTMTVSGGTGEFHTHPNKASLDQITTTEDGYINLTQLHETGENSYATETEKVKAGYADVAQDLTQDSPVRQEFLHRQVPDTAEALIKFLQGSHFGNYVQGFGGGGIDSAGNAEFESITARGFLKVFELIYNRLNALEGNTSFADVGTIESVADGGGISRQILTMRKRWEGDFTAFQVGDIIYGYVNNLENGQASEHYKVWGYVRGVDREANKLAVSLYPGGQVPSGHNAPFTAGMIITRWGNMMEADEEYAGMYPEVIKTRGNGEYYNCRQSSFYISCDDGNLVELTGVNAPKLTSGNYGTVLGKIPDGLLDADTMEMINSDQPYLYARGIIVQDLIRVSYNGAPLRTANYRGTWSAEETYHTSSTQYDTVTHNEALWQCLTDGTQEEPSGESQDWLQMAGSGDIEVWRIVPSSQYISYRYTEAGRTVITPEALSITLQKVTKDGTAEITTAQQAAAQGVAVKYRIDGGVERLYNFVPVLVSGASVSIHAEVVKGGASLAMTDIPVVKDGAKGTPGDVGLIAYPAGAYDPGTTYEATGNATPVVLYNANYYCLKRGKTYCGNAMASNRKNPATDVANGGSDARWQRFDNFSAVFADIVMANFAKLGSAVFSGEYMFSQQGKLNGATSNDYEQFGDGFRPNFSVNFRTGNLTANYGSFGGYLQSTFDKLEDSDAEYYADARYNQMGTGDAVILNNDFNIHASQFDEIVLPCNQLYIGARVMICENAHMYTRNTDYCTVYTENSTKIGGILPQGESGDNIRSGGCQVVQFRDGLLEFVCVPGTTNNVEWVLMSGCAAELHGFNTTTT